MPGDRSRADYARLTDWLAHHATRKQARQRAGDLVERGRLAYVGGTDAVDADRAEIPYRVD